MIEVEKRMPCKKDDRIPLTLEEHHELAKDIELATQILGKWCHRFRWAYNLRGRELKYLYRALELISPSLRSKMEKHWEEENKPTPYISDHRSPYRGDQIVNFSSK